MKSLPYNFLLTLLISFSLFACSSGSFEIKDLSGYWEIEKVETATNQTKIYNMNTVVDYFNLTSDSTGFRKKLNVHFSGNYQTNTVQQDFKIASTNKVTFIKHKTAEDNWQEKIITLGADALVLQHENGTIYHYKKHNKISITE